LNPIPQQVIQSIKRLGL